MNAIRNGIRPLIVHSKRYFTVYDELCKSERQMAQPIADEIVRPEETDAKPAKYGPFPIREFDPAQRYQDSLSPQNRTEEKTSSLLQIFLPSTDFYAKLHKKYDISWPAFKRWIHNKKIDSQIKSQRFIPKRHGILGPDLATAHFVTFRGGKVLFKGDTKWYAKDTYLPRTYDPNFLVSQVDATGINLHYEGIDNLILLKHLEKLNVSRNAYLDDWFCDKLKQQYRNSTTLTELDLTDCNRISERGIAALCFLPSLTKLKITGTKAASYEHLELLSMLFNDVNPNCEIVV